MIFAGLFLSACTNRQPAELHGMTMGTTWSLQLGDLPRGTELAGIDAAIVSILDNVDATLSTWNGQSEISALNRSDKTGWTGLSDDLYAVLEAARRVSVETEGAFDITVAPLVDLWGFGVDRRADEVESAAPTAQQIAAARARVGYTMLDLRATPPAARKRSTGVTLDVAAIAPGRAVDRIAETLGTLGIDDYLIEIGGEVRAHGHHPDGRPWRVAIEQPLVGTRAPYAIVELSAASISTSGDYRDFRHVGARRVSHAIDPRRGAPVEHTLAAVSVIHPSAMLADAYSTALMVLGPERGYEFACRTGLPAIFIEHADGGGFVERATPEFARYRVVDHSRSQRT